MSSRHTLVCLPPLDDPQQWAEAIDDAVQPYPDDIYTWSAFERYDSHLVTRPDAQPVPGPLVQSPRAHQLSPLRCSGSRRDLLDFDTMRAERAGQASRLYSAWEAATATMPPANPLSSFRHRHPQDSYRARQNFLAQPQLQVLSDLGVPAAQDRRGMAAALVTLDHDAFVERARQRAVPGDLLLTDDGALHINPAFIRPDADEDAESASARYLALANGYLDTLPADYLVFSLNVRLAG
ncbi:hypothetical protein ACIREO_23445 [Streptomyces sp. NPDC102441]|uniref:hypothetical protein n=1 Tax=Streptomyces sp. NPDC102441 TaxID=3366176 RepID=UPI00382BAFAC